MTMIDRILVGKIPVIETINNRLKYIGQAQYFRHRNFGVFIINLVD